MVHQHHWIHIYGLNYQFLLSFLMRLTNFKTMYMKIWVEKILNSKTILNLRYLYFFHFQFKILPLFFYKYFMNIIFMFSFTQEPTHSILCTIYIHDTYSRYTRVYQWITHFFSWHLKLLFFNTKHYIMPFILIPLTLASQNVYKMHCEVW